MVAPADTISLLIKQDELLKSLLNPGTFQVKTDMTKSQKFKFSDLLSDGIRGKISGKIRE